MGWPVSPVREDRQPNFFVLAAGRPRQGSTLNGHIKQTVRRACERRRSRCRPLGDIIRGQEAPIVMRLSAFSPARLFRFYSEGGSEPPATGGATVRCYETDQPEDVTL